LSWPSIGPGWSGCSRFDNTSPVRVWDRRGSVVVERKVDHLPA
jgi:hypothetical protein